MRNPARPRCHARGLYDAADTLRSPFPARVVAGALPRGGEGVSRCRAARASPLGVRSLFRLGPRWVPLERSGTSCRCPRPSWWCRFPLPASAPIRAAAVGGALEGEPRGSLAGLRGRHARPPRGRGAGPPQRVPRGRPRRGRVSGCRPLADRESWIFFFCCRLFFRCCVFFFFRFLASLPVFPTQHRGLSFS